MEQSHLPDPLSAGLSVEAMSESQRIPQILVDYTAALSAAGMKPILDQYLAAGEPAQVPAHLLSRLERSGSASDVKGAPTVNAALINSLVLHLASVALNQSKAQKGQLAFDAESSPFKLLKQLMYEAGPELRYALVVAQVNHLRFPNAHTMWCHRSLLALFTGATEEVQEGIVSFADQSVRARDKSLTCPLRNSSASSSSARSRAARLPGVSWRRLVRSCRLSRRRFRRSWPSCRTSAVRQSSRP